MIRISFLIEIFGNGCPKTHTLSLKIIQRHYENHGNTSATPREFDIDCR